MPLASGVALCKRHRSARIPPEHAEKARCPDNAPCKRIIPAQNVRYSNPLFQHTPLGLRLNSSAHRRATGASRLTRNNVSMAGSCHFRSVPHGDPHPATRKRPHRASSPSLGLTRRRKTRALLFPNINIIESLAILALPQSPRLSKCWLRRRSLQRENVEVLHSHRPGVASIAGAGPNAAGWVSGQDV